MIALLGSANPLKLLCGVPLKVARFFYFKGAGRLRRPAPICGVHHGAEEHSGAEHTHTVEGIN